MLRDDQRAAVEREEEQNMDVSGVSGRAEKGGKEHEVEFFAGDGDNRGEVSGQSSSSSSSSSTKTNKAKGKREIGSNETGSGLGKKERKALVSDNQRNRSGKDQEVEEDEEGTEESKMQVENNTMIVGEDKKGEREGVPSQATTMVSSGSGGAIASAAVSAPKATVAAKETISDPSGKKGKTSSSSSSSSTASARGSGEGKTDTMEVGG